MNSFLKLFQYIFLIISLVINYAYSDENKLHKKNFNNFFEGGWELIEWHEEDKIHKPPLVSERYSISPYLIHCGIFNKFNSNYKESWSGWGDYILDNEKFGYRYIEVFNVLEKKDLEIELDTSLPWKGYRYFKVKVNDNGVYMSSDSDQVQWNILKMKL